MPEPRAFKLRQAENRPNNNVGALPEIDKTRATRRIGEAIKRWS